MHGPVDPEELRARFPLREPDERRVAHILELALAAVAETERDLGGARGQRVVDTRDEIRAQAHEQEAADGREDHPEYRDGEQGHSSTDRETAHSVSNAYPTPRTVRINGRPNGSSSLRRR